MNIPKIKKPPRLLSMATLLICCLLVTVIMTPPEVFAKAFWYLFSNIAMLFGSSPDKTVGSFLCQSAYNETVDCTLYNYANDEGIVMSHSNLWVWLIRSIAASSTITIFVSLYVKRIYRIALLQMEYNVCEENIELLKKSLQETVNTYIIKYHNGRDDMFRHMADYYKYEFDKYLQTLHSELNEKRKQKNSSSTSEFDFS